MTPAPAPAPDWNKIWAATQELGAAIAPLLEMGSPPVWAVSLRLVMDAVVRDVEDRCLTLGVGDE